MDSAKAESIARTAIGHHEVSANEVALSNFSVRAPSLVRRRRGALYRDGGLVKRSLVPDVLADALSGLLDTLPGRVPERYVEAAVRVVVRADRAVLIEHGRPADGDLATLAKEGLDEIPCVMAWLDPDGPTVIVGSRNEQRSWPISGVVLDTAQDAKSLHHGHPSAPMSASSRGWLVPLLRTNRNLAVTSVEQKDSIRASRRML